MTFEILLKPYMYLYNFKKTLILQKIGSKLFTPITFKIYENKENPCTF